MLILDMPTIKIGLMRGGTESKAEQHERKKRGGRLSPGLLFLSLLSPLAVPLTEGEFSTKPGPSGVSDLYVRVISPSLSHESVDMIVMSTWMTSVLLLLLLQTQL